jgi:hypothetical protein
MGLKGLSVPFAVQQAKDTAAALAQSRINEINQADVIKQAQDKRLNDSITQQPKQGIIASQMRLTRMNGTPVYNSNGSITR